MEFQITTHWKEYSEKPSKSEVGYIRALEYNRVTTVTIPELAAILESGRTILGAVHDVKNTNYLTTCRQTFISQQLFALDIDHANMSLEALKAKLATLPFNYCMIYKTFSFTEDNKRWRVLFLNDSPITTPEYVNFIYRYLIYSMAKNYTSEDALKIDTRGFDTARLTFGAKEVVEVNPGAICNFETILTRQVRDTVEMFFEQLKEDKKKLSEATKTKLLKTQLEERQISLEEHQLSDVLNTNYGNSLNSSTCKNANDYDILYEIICDNLRNMSFHDDKPESIDVNDAYFFVDNLEITDIIKSDGFIPQINTLFNCILPGHVDNTPSAHIIHSLKNPSQQVYYCFGCMDNHVYKTFDLIHLIFEEYHRLQGEVFTKWNTLNLIFSLLEIEIGSRFQLKVLKQLIHDKKYISKLKPDSEFQKILARKRIKGFYLNLFDLAQEKVSYESLIKEDEKYSAVFIATNTYMSHYMTDRNLKGCSSSGVNAKINWLVRMGLMDKIDYDDLTPSVQLTLEEYKNKMLLRESDYISAEHLKKPCVYKLKFITNEVITNCVGNRDYEKRWSARAKGQGTKQTTALYGEKRSSEVYNQSKVTYSKKDKRYLEEANLAIKHLIETQRYFTEDELDKNIDKNRNYFTKKAKEKYRIKLLTELMKENNLIKKRCNKRYREIFGIPADVKCDILFIDNID